MTNDPNHSSRARYRVGVRDHFMIAHSFRGAMFGPAQRLHGATYVVDVVFSRATLDEDGVVIDIGLASQAVREVLAELDYRNLDDEPAFSGRNTTTEFLARAIFDRLAARIASDEFSASAGGLDWLSVTLNESHRAWASYEGPLPEPRE